VGNRHHGALVQAHVDRQLQDQFTEDLDTKDRTTTWRCFRWRSFQCGRSWQNGLARNPQHSCLGN